MEKTADPTHTLTLRVGAHLRADADDVVDNPVAQRGRVPAPQLNDGLAPFPVRCLGEGGAGRGLVLDEDAVVGEGQEPVGDAVGEDAHARVAEAVAVHAHGVEHVEGDKQPHHQVGRAKVCVLGGAAEPVERVWQDVVLDAELDGPCYPLVVEDGRGAHGEDVKVPAEAVPGTHEVGHVEGAEPVLDVESALVSGRTD